MPFVKYEKYFIDFSFINYYDFIHST